MVQNTLRQKALKLRIEGKSYGEILKKLNLTSKGTLSYWFKKLKLSPEAKDRLKNNIFLARKRGLFSYNRNRTKKIIIENEIILNKSIKNTPLVTKQTLLLIGASLYWGEGSLRKPEGKYPFISFSNSDPKMIKVFIHYLRVGLGIADSKIKARIQIHPNISREKAKFFWSGIINLPEDRFHIFEQISRVSKFKRKINFLPYGTLTIRVNSRQLFYRIKGTISGISNQIN